MRRRAWTGKIAGRPRPRGAGLRPRRSLNTGSRRRRSRHRRSSAGCSARSRRGRSRGRGRTACTPPNGISTGRDVVVVDPAGAGLQPGHHAVAAGEVAGEDAGGQAVFGGVGAGAPPRPRRRRSAPSSPGRRSPPARSPCRRWQASKIAGSTKKPPGQAPGRPGRWPPQTQPGAGLRPGLDIAQHLVPMVGRDQGADLGRRVHRVADPHPLGAGQQAGP